MTYDSSKRSKVSPTHKVANIRKRNRIEFSGRVQISHVIQFGGSDLVVLMFQVKDEFITDCVGSEYSLSVTKYLKLNVVGIQKNIFSIISTDCEIFIVRFFSYLSE